MSKLGEHVSVPGVAVVTAAVVMFGWIGYELSGWPPAPPGDAAASTPSAQASDAPQSKPQSTSNEPSTEPSVPSPPLRVALLSDGLALDDSSWFNRTIAAREVDGLAPGAIASQAGLSATQLEARVPLTAPADVVVVQAGTIDLTTGSSAETAGEALEGLLQSVVDLGGPNGGPQVVWITIPPVDTAPSNVLTVNDRVRTFAGENDIVVWDLTSPVATPTGAWRPGLSAEGIAPNDAGQAAQARAAVAAAQETLPDLAAR